MSAFTQLCRPALALVCASLPHPCLVQFFSHFISLFNFTHNLTQVAEALSALQPDEPPHSSSATAAAVTFARAPRREMSSVASRLPPDHNDGLLGRRVEELGGGARGGGVSMLMAGVHF